MILGHGHIAFSAWVLSVDSNHFQPPIVRPQPLRRQGWDHGESFTFSEPASKQLPIQLSPARHSRSNSQSSAAAMEPPAAHPGPFRPRGHSLSGQCQSQQHLEPSGAGRPPKPPATPPNAKSLAASSRELTGNDSPTASSTRPPPEGLDMASGVAPNSDLQGSMPAPAAEGWDRGPSRDIGEIRSHIRRLVELRQRHRQAQERLQRAKNAVHEVGASPHSDQHALRE